MSACEAVGVLLSSFSGCAMPVSASMGWCLELVSSRRIPLARPELWITPRKAGDKWGAGVDNCSTLWKPHSRVTTDESGACGACCRVWTTTGRLSTLPGRFSTDGYVGILGGAALLIPRSYPFYGDDFS